MSGDVLIKVAEVIFPPIILVGVLFMIFSRAAKNKTAPADRITELEERITKLEKRSK